MKVYLAGPMRGISLFNFPAFDAEAARLRSQGHFVFSPAERDRKDGLHPEVNPFWSKGEQPPHGIDYYMAIDLPEVCQSDAVVLLPGWEDSRGCKIEVSVARQLGKKILYAESLSSVPATILDGALYPIEREVRITDPSGGQKGVKLERFDLIPVWALREIARVYGFGETKYPTTSTGPNWRKGYKWGLSFGAMLRHCTLFWMGEEKDKESSLHHLAHAAWHCLTLMTFWREKLGTDNRWDKTCPETN